MLGNHYPTIGEALATFRREQTDSVLAHPDPREPAA